MITAPNKYLGISADKLPYIATELEQKNATLTAENVRLQKEFEAEHALAETLGHDCERLKDKNTKLLELVYDMWNDMSVYYAQHESPDSGDMKFHGDRMRELGIEVEL